MDENFNEILSFDLKCPNPNCLDTMSEVKRRRGSREFECRKCHYVAKITTRQKILKETFAIICAYVGGIGFALGIAVLGLLRA